MTEKVKYPGLEREKMPEKGGKFSYPGLGEGAIHSHKLPRTDELPTAEIKTAKLAHADGNLGQVEFPEAELKTTVKKFRLGEYK